jgi:hypothetical protein
MTTASTTASTIGSAIGALGLSSGLAMAAPPDRKQGAVADAMLRLVNRMTYGYTREELDLAIRLGAEGYIDYHLHPESIDDAAVDARLAAAEYDVLRKTPDELWNLYYQGGTFDSSPMVSGLIGATALRAARSKRQFFERVVDFWSDHFSIYLYADFCDILKVWDDTNVIRKHALGNFRSLLTASAKSPAMLNYLNNNTNVKNHPNENYAREVLELHTMGVDGGYTQQDVMTVARCFTGWTHFVPGTPTASFHYRFDPAVHDYTAKTLFVGTEHEVTIAPGGEVQGLKVIEILSRHPSTAKFIARKMLKRFWGEQPADWMVDGVAQVFLATDGNLREVFRAVLRLNLQPAVPKKYKRPFHLLISTIRAFDADFPSWPAIASLSYLCGHYPFFWPAPNGYPDALGYWSSLQLARWNMGAMLLDSRYPSTYYNASKMMAGAVGTDGVLKRIEERFLGEPMLTQERAALRAFIGQSSATPPWSKLQDALSIATTMPSFQWY